MSITPDEVRASTPDVPGAPPLPETQIERMVQVLNRHRSARTPVAADESAASESAAPAAAAPESQQT